MKKLLLKLLMLSCLGLHSIYGATEDPTLEGTRNEVAQMLHEPKPESDKFIYGNKQLKIEYGPYRCERGPNDTIELRLPPPLHLRDRLRLFMCEQSSLVMSGNYKAEIGDFNYKNFHNPIVSTLFRPWYTFAQFMQILFDVTIEFGFTLKGLTQSDCDIGTKTVRFRFTPPAPKMPCMYIDIRVVKVEVLLGIKNAFAQIPLETSSNELGSINVYNRETLRQQGLLNRVIRQAFEQPTNMGWQLVDPESLPVEIGKLTGFEVNDSHYRPCSVLIIELYKGNEDQRVIADITTKGEGSDRTLDIVVRRSSNITHKTVFDRHKECPTLVDHVLVSLYGPDYNVGFVVNHRSLESIFTYLNGLVPNGIELANLMIRIMQNLGYEFVVKYESNQIMFESRQKTIELPRFMGHIKFHQQDPEYFYGLGGRIPADKQEWYPVLASKQPLLQTLAYMLKGGSCK